MVMSLINYALLLALSMSSWMIDNITLRIIAINAIAIAFSIIQHRRGLNKGIEIGREAQRQSVN